MTAKAVRRKSRQRVRITANNSEDEVGYGKPPRQHQFKPGSSGNPKGRPKGVRNEATILRELLQRKIGINENGRRRKISLLEAVLRKVLEDCLKGNIKSAAFLLNRYNSLISGDTGPQEIGEEDKVVLDAYLRQNLHDGEE